MKPFIKIFKFMFTWLSILLFSFIAHGGGGGTDVAGGSDGRFTSIAKARFLSEKIINEIESLPESQNQFLNEFYIKNRSQLLLEISKSEITMRPQNLVFLRTASNSRINKRAVTGLTNLSEIAISDSLGLASIVMQDLVLIIIHESGHHLGVPQEEDKFLDQLAIELTHSASKKDPSIQRELESNVIWSPCTPDQNPTRTPHCLLNKVYDAENGSVVFQLAKIPYGTCKTTIISAGTFSQVLASIIENQKKLDSFYCASISLHDEQTPSQSNFVTPHCKIDKINENTYTFTHSASKVPLLVGTKSEVFDLKKKIELFTEFCGQGIFSDEVF